VTPRRSAAEAAGTRAAIVDRAVEVSSVDGLEGLTIGRLAGELGMSKSGVIGHFGSKEALQLAALDAAVERFTRDVWESAAGAPEGLPRLEAIVDRWLDHLGKPAFPGGCYLTAAACEFDGRAGPVRDAVDRALRRWLRVLEREAAVAVDAGDMPPGTDPAQVAFELNALASGANQELQLRREPEAIERARRAMRRVLTSA
jgi:AcrR family transcriptional regulator